MRKVWNPLEDDRLRTLYAQYPAAIIATVLGLTEDQVWRRARRLGMRRPAAQTAEIARQHMLDPGHPARRTQFQSGLRPWNQGIRFVAGGRSAQTRFKPGRRPEEARNYAPIGSLRIADGYLQRKITDDPGLYPTARWEAEHRIVWMAAHGPVPEGHRVAFRPGLKTLVEADITLDRLELITMAENARRNRGHHYPPELKDAIRQLRTLRRTIEEASR